MSESKNDEQAELASEEFGKAAIRLLREQSVKIRELRMEAIDLMKETAEFRDADGPRKKEYLRRRGAELFRQSNQLQDSVYALNRKVSQWLEHAQQMPAPIDLEVRTLVQRIDQEVDVLVDFVSQF